jgi:uncharacterized protein DUF6801
MTRQYHRAATVLRLTIVAVTLFWGITGPGARPAGADTASLTIRYTCSFPPFGSQPLTALVRLTGSLSVPVGRATPRMPIDASATTTDTVTRALGAVGATTVDGTVDATATVTNPAGTTTVVVPLTVPPAAVPASGPLTVRATGTTPALVFHRPGTGRIRVGGLVLHLTPRNADGAATMAGTVTITCQADPGQNLVLTSFTLTATGATPRPAPTDPTPIPRATKRSPDHTTAPAPTTTPPATGPPPTTTPTPAAPTTATTTTSDLAVATAATRDAPAGPALAAVCAVVVAAGAALALFWWRRDRRARGKHRAR